MKRVALAAAAVCLVACTTRGPQAMSASELKAKGTRTYDAPFDEAFDAAYLSLEKAEGHISVASRSEGTFENDKVPMTAPAGWGGDAFRSYAVSVFQTGSQVSVSAIPRLWQGDKDVSEEPLWQLGGYDGEDVHWDRLFDGIEDLLKSWREVPELTIERSRGEIAVLDLRFYAPADWRGLELSADHRQATAQSTLRGAPGCPECPGGLNPSMVFEVSRRHPALDTSRLERAALEAALGPSLAEPAAWSTEQRPTGLRGTGEVVAGDPSKTVSVAWHTWDAGETAWMIRASAACSPDGPASCDLAWDAMVNGVARVP